MQRVDGYFHLSRFFFPVYRWADYQFSSPESTLIMLVSAFYGYQQTMDAYKVAVKEKYRFFSFGDAMLVV